MKVIILFLLSFLFPIICGRCETTFNQSRHSKDTEIRKLEKSFLMLKPDCLKNGLVGECIKRFEEGCQSCKLLALKTVWPNETQVRMLYDSKKGRDWFHYMIDYMTSGPVIPMIWEGENMPAVGREILCKIREDFGATRVAVGHVYNIIHGSDTVEDAKREIKIWFTEPELADMFKD